MPPIGRAATAATDFTAAWCVTCQVNERLVLNTDTVRDAFAKHKVALLRADWTRRDAQISTFLTEQGAAGVPLYLWSEPGADPEQLPQVLTAEMLIELAERPR